MGLCPKRFEAQRLGLICTMCRFWPYPIRALPLTPERMVLCTILVKAFLRYLINLHIRKKCCRRFSSECATQSFCFTKAKQEKLFREEKLR